MRSPCLAVACFVLVFFAQSVRAGECFFEWLGPDGGNWDDSNSWDLVAGSIFDCETVPEEEDDIAIVAESHLIIQEKTVLPLEAIDLRFATISNANTIRLLGGDSSIWWSGDFSGTGTVEIGQPGSVVPPSPALVLGGSGNRSLLLGQTLINYRSIDMWKSVYLDSLSSIRNEGLFEVRGGADFWETTSGASGAGSFENLGTFLKSGIGTTTIVEGPFINAGDIVVQGGVLRFANAFSHDPATGSLLVESGATVQFASTTGTAVLPDGLVIEGAGTTSFDGGASIHVPGNTTIETPLVIDVSTTQIAVDGTLTTVGDLEWRRGRFTGTGTTVVENALAVTGNSQAYILDGHTFVTRGATAITSSIELDSLSTLRNEGVFDVQDSSDFPGTTLGAMGVGTFENLGTFLKSGRSTTQFDGPFVNSGDIVVQAGDLEFSGGFTQVGGQLVLESGEVSTGVPSVALEVSTGLLAGSGVVGSDLVVGGTIAPGLSAGTIHIEGDASFGGASTFHVEVGGLTPGTEHDAVLVDDKATLGGSLQVELIDNFGPSILPTDSFQILASGTQVIGEFGNVSNGERVFSSDGDSFVVEYDTLSVQLINFRSGEPTAFFLFSGTGAGGTVSLLIEGELVLIATSAGESSVSVVARLASEIGANSPLRDAGVVATVDGSELQLNSAITVDDLQIQDWGLGVQSSPEVPGLSNGWLAVLVFSLAARGVASIGGRRLGRTRS